MYPFLFVGPSKTILSWISSILVATICSAIIGYNSIITIATIIGVVTDSIILIVIIVGPLFCLAAINDDKTNVQYTNVCNTYTMLIIVVVATLC